MPKGLVNCNHPLSQNLVPEHHCFPFSLLSARVIIILSYQLGLHFQFLMCKFPRRLLFLKMWVGGEFTAVLALKDTSPKTYNRSIQQCPLFSSLSFKHYHFVIHCCCSQYNMFFLSQSSKGTLWNQLLDRLPSCQHTLDSSLLFLSSSFCNISRHFLLFHCSKQRYIISLRLRPSGRSEGSFQTGFALVRSHFARQLLCYTRHYFVLLHCNW